VPLSISLTAAFTMILNFLAVLPLFALYGVFPSPSWLLVIPLLIPLLAFCTGLGMLLSVVYVGFEDIGEIWSLISRMMLYLSPVLYPIEIVPERFQTLLTAANPLAPIIQQARVWIIGGDIARPAEIAGFWLGVAVPLTTIALIALAGLALFIRRAPHVAEAL
jgi:ABC-type polysaccharide/polyol phosphate export permease